MNDQAQRLKQARERLDRLEGERLSPRAALSGRALRRRPDALVESGHRQNFQVDTDRILHSKAYTRYIDKTQVFYLIKHDHISHRVLHVQLVSKISRTIGRLLALNEDLIEAVALGHDLGHAPFGHDGESYLSQISESLGTGPFVHSVQSVRALDVLENKGRGLNLSLQVLDGILAHDGEADLMNLAPDPDKDFARLDKEAADKGRNPGLSLRPMTLEGCVVRLADTIAYIGRDMEDALRLGLIKREEIPPLAAEVLGTSNGTIVYRLVEDLIATSLEEDRVGYSARVAAALGEMKRFNYGSDLPQPQDQSPRAAMIKDLYRRPVRILSGRTGAGRRKSPLTLEFLADMDGTYLDSTPPALMVRDFMAGMTDDYFLAQAQSRFFSLAPIN